MKEFEIKTNQTIINARADLYKLRQQKMMYRLAGHLDKTAEVQRKIERLEKEIREAIEWMKDA